MSNELKFERLGDANKTYPASTLVIRKQYVDAAIDELKAENERLTIDQRNAELRADVADATVEKMQAKNAELKDEINELRVDLEGAKATAYAESIDAGMENRKLKRALWLARAKRALEKIAWFKLWNASISTMNPEDGARQEFDKWKKALGKFLAKAEQYK